MSFNDMKMYEIVENKSKLNRCDSLYACCHVQDMPLIEEIKTNNQSNISTLLSKATPLPKTILKKSKPLADQSEFYLGDVQHMPDSLIQQDLETSSSLPFYSSEQENFFKPNCFECSQPKNCKYFAERSDKKVSMMVTDQMNNLSHHTFHEMTRRRRQSLGVTLSTSTIASDLKKMRLRRFSDVSSHRACWKIDPSPYLITEDKIIGSEMQREEEKINVPSDFFCNLL